LSASTGLVLRLLGIRPSSEPTVTEEEIKVLIEQGTEAGIFEEAEEDMVAGVFRLGDRRVNELMTPRTGIIWLDLEDPPERIRQTIIESVHSRFPVAKGSLDEIQGIVEAKDMLARCLQGMPLDPVASLEAPFYVPETMPALKVLEAIKQARLQMVMVIDEFGGLQGLVTLNDILEAIVGDIPMVGVEEDPEIVQREDGSWLLDGMLPVDEFKELFRVGELPNEERGTFRTLAGFVVTYLGRIPAAGDQFEWAGFRFEVVDMDELRVDKILVIPLAASSPAG
jgi:putative hemolysin